MSTKNNKILVTGSKGTRLKPYTVVLPKPLMPIGEYPILEVVIRQLASHGFNHITISVNHQAELIKTFFGNGSKWDIKIDYSMEDKPLGTMGPIRLISDLPEDFLVMNGDILTDLNYSQFYQNHINNNNMFTISSYSRSHMIDYGVLKTNENCNLIGFSEKPIKKYEVSMGIYMVNRLVLNYIPESNKFGFDDLMLTLLKKQKTVIVKSYSGNWLDIGRPDDYVQAIEQFSKMKDKYING